MAIYCRGTAQVRHKISGQLYNIESTDLSWDSVDSNEREMGTEIHYEAILDHPELGTLVWDIWEYPIGIRNDSDTRTGHHTLIKNFDFGIKYNDPEYDWADYPTPADPYAIFLDSYHRTGDLLADHGEKQGNGLLNRMVFSHQITALEAYLGDTLSNAVMADKAAMERLIDGDDELNKEKFTLAEIVREPNLISQKVRRHLRAILYHNIGRVDVLYNMSLGFRILTLASDKRSLFNAIKLRHDCVHRNGFDDQGNELTIFTKEFVRNTCDLIRLFVDKIEEMMQSRKID